MYANFCLRAFDEELDEHSVNKFSPSFMSSDNRFCQRNHAYRQQFDFLFQQPLNETIKLMT